MPKTVKTTYTAINLETGEVYTGIDAPQSITRGETHFWQASKDFFAALLGYGTVESKVVAGMLHHTDPKTNHIACTSAELKKEISCTRDTVASAVKKMESKRLIIGIGQGVWMLNPRMLAMGNQTQIALLMAEYDRYVSEKTGVALVAGKYVLKNPVTAEELPLPPECDDKLMFLDGNVQFWKIYDAFFTAVAGLSENELRVLLHMIHTSNQTAVRIDHCVDNRSANRTARQAADNVDVRNGGICHVCANRARIVTDSPRKRTVVALVCLDTLAADALADGVTVLAEIVAKLPERGIVWL